MAILHKNITASGDIHNPKWHPDANNGDYAWKNEKGELESIDELLLPAALNFVDGSVAPPTSNTNDIYILSSGASVNAGWGSVALQDWVKYDGAVWNVITPQKSSLCYDKTADSLMSFNGTAWAAIGGGGGGGNTIYTANDTIGSNRVATITDSLTFAGGKLILSSTNDGILLNRLTDLQMDSLKSSATADEVIFNTTKHALYRFDSTLGDFVALAAGFGIVGTTDSTGKPTFYATVKAAYISGQGSIKLYSDITETTSRVIQMVNGRDIDLNGYSYTYSATDNSSMFQTLDQNCTFRIINGRLLRTNGASSTQLKLDKTQTQIDIINVYAENSNGSCLNTKAGVFNGYSSTFKGTSGVTFNTPAKVSGGTYVTSNGQNNNFNCTHVQNAVFRVDGIGRNVGGGTMNNCEFYSENNAALNFSSSTVTNSYIKSVSGNATQNGVNSTMINCLAISGSATVALATLTCKIIDSTLITASGSACVSNVEFVEGCTIINNGTGVGILNSDKELKIINNIIRLTTGSADGINLITNANCQIFGNTIYLNNSAAAGIKSNNVGAFLSGNTVKGSTILSDLGTGTNLFTSTTDAQGNAAQL